MQTPEPRLGWYRSITKAQKLTLIAAGSGWMLDAMDVMLYSMLLSQLMATFGMSPSTAGLLNTVTLTASALGGLLFGFFADRFGRVKALSSSILIYAIMTCACGFARNLVQLAIFRFFLGLGMGGEWGSGAALIAETWPAPHRGKAMGLVQGCWAIGYAMAALIAGFLLPRFGWRSVFWFGLLPALTVIWIRRHVPEPEIWTSSKAKKEASIGLFALLKPPLFRSFLVVTAMNAGTMFAWWGLFTWIPAFLTLPASQGGEGLDLLKSTSWIVVMQFGTWLGYVSFGFLADRFGRKRCYISFLGAATAVTLLYGTVHNPLLLLAIGPLVGFFGSGYFSGIGTITAELFPTPIRATAQGLSYNFGRGLSAAAPFSIGLLATRLGLGHSFILIAGIFLFSAAIASFLPADRSSLSDLT